MVTSIENMISRWHASVYEKKGDAGKCIHMLETLLGFSPRKIFEAGVGTGKIAHALSKKNHAVTGMDVDREMLFYAHKRAQETGSLCLMNADILVAPWPRDFDAVLIAENLMHSLITDWEYKQAQKQLIMKSAASLKKGGLLILDFDCPVSLANLVKNACDRCVLSGTDESGTSGKMIVRDAEADEKSRLLKSKISYALTTEKGENIDIVKTVVRHFLTLEETTSWLYRAGFCIEALYGSYDFHPFDEKNRRCVIAARKE